MKIYSPDDAQLQELCGQLRELSASSGDRWPSEQLRLCGEYGVYEWFLPHSVGGQQWNERQIVAGYLELSASCLTTTFIITQYMGACRRIAASKSAGLADRLLPRILTGESFATVGISHLTTSHRHLGKPVLTASQHSEGFLLNGFSPWVTGAAHADTVVIGATFDDGRQMLTAVPTNLAGVSTPEPPRLVGLNGSRTGRIELENVVVSLDHVIDGPVHDIMQRGSGAKTGGLQTSTLAAGLATEAVEFLKRESKKRGDLTDPTEHLAAEVSELRDDLLKAADGELNCTLQELRARSNSLVLRTTQSALVAAKGRGYAEGHVAGRWCQEALFFLVWSCPQPVLNANLCELAGITV